MRRLQAWHSDVAPLCPAGHLPLKGGDRPVTSGFANLQRCRLETERSAQPISPLEGEMSGRTEGGDVRARPSKHDRPRRHPPPHRRPLRRVGRPALRPHPRRHADRLHPRGRASRRHRNPPRAHGARCCSSARPAPRPRPSATAAQAAGFIIDAADPRRSIAACPGSPACASGHIPARAIAAEIAASSRRRPRLRPARLRLRQALRQARP